MIYQFDDVVGSCSGPSQQRIRSTIMGLVLVPALAITALSGVPSRAAAQVVPPDGTIFERPEGLRGMLRDLFQFSLDPSSRDPNGPAGVQLAGRGFAASTVETNRLLIEFMESAIAGNLSNIPFASTNASFSVSFDGGAPRVSRSDPGPIVAERARTLGKGRILVAASYITSHFTSIRGADLSNMRFNFAHSNRRGAGCNQREGGDCDLYGFPAYENDIMQVDLGLDLQISTLSFVFAYGALDWLDVTVALPIVFSDLEGNSQAQIIPFEGPPATNFFGGTRNNPQLISGQQFVNGSASGVGDPAVRLKATVARSESTHIAGIVEACFPTGSEDDLLGAGQFVARGLGIVSSKFGDFSPHLNAGFLYRRGGLLKNAVLATAGFDNELAPWVTFAIDLTAQFQVGGSALRLPKTVTLRSPYIRTIEATNITSQRDDIIDAAFGFKFSMSSGLVFVVNSTWPLNDGGVRSNWSLMGAVEYSF